MDDNSSDLKNLHFKIEKKSHGKGTSVIYLLVANPSEDPATRAPGDIPQDNAKAFLNRLVPAVEAGELEAQIKGQEEVLRKSQKKKNGLADDKTSLEKRSGITRAIWTRTRRTWRPNNRIWINSSRRSIP